MWTDESRFNFELTCFFWSALYVLFNLYVIQTKLSEFKFMSLFTMDTKQDSKIKPSDLRLNKVDAEKFLKMRQHWLKVSNFLIQSITTNGPALLLFQFYRKSLLSINIYVSIAWFMHFTFCARASSIGKTSLWKTRDFLCSV